MVDACTECGEPVPPDDAICNRDAADEPHVFHSACWAAFRWWLSGHDDEPTAAYVARIRKSLTITNRGVRPAFLRTRTPA